MASSFSSLPDSLQMQVFEELRATEPTAAIRLANSSKSLRAHFAPLFWKHLNLCDIDLDQLIAVAPSIKDWFLDAELSWTGRDAELDPDAQMFDVSAAFTIFRRGLSPARSLAIDSRIVQVMQAGLLALSCAESAAKLHALQLGLTGYFGYARDLLDAPYLYGALSQAASLRTLHLAGCRVYDDGSWWPDGGAHRFIVFLARMPNLTVLFFEYCSIEEQQAVPDCKFVSLRHLAVTECTGSWAWLDNLLVAARDSLLRLRLGLWAQATTVPVEPLALFGLAGLRELEELEVLGDFASGEYIDVIGESSVIELTLYPDETDEDVERCLSAYLAAFRRSDKPFKDLYLLNVGADAMSERATALLADIGPLLKPLPKVDAAGKAIVWPQGDETQPRASAFATTRTRTMTQYMEDALQWADARATKKSQADGSRASTIAKKEGQSGEADYIS